MTPDPNNWTDPAPIMAIAGTHAVSSCRRCGAVVLVLVGSWHNDGLALHDAWHQELVSAIDQARA